MNIVLDCEILKKICTILTAVRLPRFLVFTISKFYIEHQTMQFLIMFVKNMLINNAFQS